MIVALVVKEGDVFTADYFNKLEALTDEVYAMHGVRQESVTSLFTPNVRFTEVVEDGSLEVTWCQRILKPPPVWLG